MDQIRRIFGKYIYNEEYSLEARVMNMVIVFGILSAALALIMRSIEQAPPIVTISMSLIIVILCIGFWAVNRFDINRYAVPIVIVALGDLLFPFLFFAHGGQDSGIAVFFLIPVLAMFLLVHGWRRIVLFFLQTLVVVFCYGVAMQPEPMIPIVQISATQSFVDMVLSWMVTGSFIGLVALFQRLIYEKEKERADAAMLHVNRLVELRETVNQVAMMLLSADKSNESDSLTKGLKLLAEGFDVDAVRIWRVTEEDDECVTIALFDWYSPRGHQIDRSAGFTAELSKFGDMIEVLSRRKEYMRIAVDNPEIPDNVKSVLRVFGMGSSLMIPIITHEDIWGFVSFAALDKNRIIDTQEAVSMHSAVMILAESIILQQTMSDLVSAREQALSGLKSRSDFLANMSHEIRTPISAVIGMTNLALADTDSERNAVRLNKIKEASNHLMGVISDILDMSKIESGKFNLRIEPFYVKAMIDRSVSIIRFRADERYQRLHHFMDPDVPDRLIGDEQRIAQVIMNLLSNAVKFTPEEGNVELRCAVRRLNDGVCTVEFAVIDDGIGVDPDKQGKLFDSFEQIETGTTRRYGGTGLGLAISKSIADTMGGCLEVESCLGKGSTFRFSVPLPVADANDDIYTLSEDADKEVEALKELIDKRMLDMSAYTVLVAEDMDINYEILEALLEPTGINLDRAHDGREVLEKYRDQSAHYDLILMDLQMPEMNGFEATGEIRKSGLSDALYIPIIAMTANVLAEDISLCYQSGMNGHLGKPLDILQLLGAIKYHLNISAGVVDG